MAMKSATYNSTGPFPYDDTVYYAVNTDGQLFVGAVPTQQQNVLRLADLTTILGAALPLSVDAASVVGTASKASREDHVHTSANILGTGTPVAVATAAVVGTSTLLSRQDHVHIGCDLASAQTIAGRKTYSTDLVSPLIIGGTAVGSSISLKSTEGVGTTDFIRFLVGNNGATEVMRVLSGGQLAIGATTAAQKVQIHADSVWGASGTEGQLSVRGSTNTNFQCEIGVDTTTGFGYIAAALLGTGWRNLILAPAGGLVGIGVTAPGQLLHVAGRMQLGGTAVATTDWALTSGWGANATISAVTGTDSRGTVTVTTSALDTPGTAPVITLTFKNGTWTTVPFAVACMSGSSTGPLNVGIVCNTTATTLVITYSGTPTATTSLTYIFNYYVIA